MNSPCLSAGGVCFLDLPVPAERFGLPCGRLTGDRRISSGLPCSASDEVRLGWASLLPRGRWCPRMALRGPWSTADFRSAFPTRHCRFDHQFRQPFLTRPRQRFTCVRPSSLSLARSALVVKARLGHYPSAFARFVTWRLRGSGTGLDTGQD